MTAIRNPGSDARATRDFPPYAVLLAPTRLGRAVMAGAWVYRRWRTVVIALHVGIVALFAVIALLAAIALPGSLASAVLGLSIILALWFAFRLPATLGLARKRGAQVTERSDQATRNTSARRLP